MEASLQRCIDLIEREIKAYLTEPNATKGRLENALALLELLEYKLNK